MGCGERVCVVGEDGRCALGCARRPGNPAHSHAMLKQVKEAPENGSAKEREERQGGGEAAASGKEDEIEEYMGAPLPENEAERKAKLDALKILDTVSVCVGGSVIVCVSHAKKRRPARSRRRRRPAAHATNKQTTKT